MESAGNRSVAHSSADASSAGRSAGGRATGNGTPRRRRWFAVVTAVMVVAVLSLLAWAASLRWSERHDPFESVDRSAFQILVLGGSAAAGEPYETRVDFGRLVAWQFDGRMLGRPIQVRNFGGPGKNAAETLDDVRRLVGLGFDPRSTVALVYVGNNEFLEFDAQHDLSAQTRQLCDVPTISEAQRATVLRAYEAKLETILRLLRDARIPTIASTIAVNQKDWEPNRSVLRDATHREDVRRLLEEGDRRWNDGDVTGALDAFRELVGLEPTFALAHFRSGECRRRLGRRDEAREDFRRAIDLDGNPYRETSAQERLLREACGRLDVPLVDGARILAEASPEGLIGFETMWDNCHPTLDGYAKIAEGYVEQIERMFDVRRARETATGQVLEQALGVDQELRKNVLASRGKYCYVASTLTWAPQARLRRAANYLQQAEALAPDDADLVCSRAVLAALLDQGAESLALWQKAYGLDPRLTRRRADNAHVRQLMRRCGQPQFATQLGE